MSEPGTMSFDDALKAEYSEPAIETQAEPQQPPLQELPPDPVPANADEVGTSQAGEDWRGNPDYFQSGARQGQLKKKTGRQPLMTYEAKEGDSVVGGDLITGAMFLSIIDLLIPGLIVLVNNMMVKDTKYLMQHKDMALSEETLSKLKTLADSTLRRIKLRGNPMAWLFVTMLGMYGFRFAQFQFEVKLREALAAKDKPKE